jgi:predicted AAA+ superfamily ATPase
MIARTITDYVDTLLKEFPAVVLLGPRQVGKTTLAKNLLKKHKKKTLYFDLESDADLARLKDAAYVFDQYPDHCIVIDEVQRMPALFAKLRPVIDKNRKPGRFILTGSASPDLVKGVSESLAGRIAFAELAPINLMEAKSSRISQQRHWFRGGFPLALTAGNDAAATRWMENFMRTYIERDLSLLFGVSLSEKIMRNFWYMLAAHNGSIWNGETFARALGVTSPTIKRYLDFLEGAFLLRQLPAWYVNAGKRLVKAPKVYLRDSGLLHVLNRIHSADELPLHLTVGSSWEGYVIEQIHQCKPTHIDLYYYRTHHGAECDVLLVDGIKPVMAVEIKHSSTPSVSKGFYTVMDDLKIKRGYIVTPKNPPFQQDKRVQSGSLIQFLQEVIPTL